MTHAKWRHQEELVDWRCDLTIQEVGYVATPSRRKMTPEVVVVTSSGYCPCEALPSPIHNPEDNHHHKVRTKEVHLTAAAGPPTLETR